MKRITAVLGMSLSVVALAQVPQMDCRPYSIEANLAQKNIANFELNLIKLSDKVRVLEDRIDERMKLLQPVLAKIDQLSLQENQIQQTRVSILRNERDLQLEIQSLGQRVMLLEQEIQQLQVVIDNPRTSMNARRNALLQQNRKRRELNGIIEERNFAIQKNQEIRSEISRTDQQLSQINTNLAQLNGEKLSIENMNPSLSFLKQKRDEAQKDLDNEGLGRQRVVELLNLALEKELMCKTYTIKYPTSLSIMAKIKKVGCQRYKPLEMPRVPRDTDPTEVEADFVFAQQAESEVLDILCP